MNPHDDSVDSLVATLKPALLSTKVFLDRSHCLEVVVQEYAVDWNYLGESTTVRAQTIIRSTDPGYHYVIPPYTVSCTGLCPEFIKRMRQCRIAWAMRMSKALGSANQRREWKRASSLDRTIVFSGVLVAEGGCLDAHDVLKRLAADNKC